MMSRRSYWARDARRYQRSAPGNHTASPGQLPDIFVPHYEEHCACFSCQWVRETKDRYVLSKLESPSYPVANPTHLRVSQDERQRLLTPVPKKKFQIMYIYAMQLEDKTWGWVVVPPQPLLPFLLTDEKYSEVSRFARNPVRGWFGLRNDGQEVDMEQEMVPPLYNPLYKHYGYHPQCSPYCFYRPPPQGSASDNETNFYLDDCASSSTLSFTTSSSPESRENNSSSEDQAVLSVGNKDEPPCERQTVLPTSGHTNSTPMDHTNLATDEPTNQSTEGQTENSPEVQATYPKLLDRQLIPESDDWLVIDTHCANPPEPSGSVNNRCSHPHHNGKYYRPGCDDRHTNQWNTTIFVGGLNAHMTRQDLHAWFEGFGELMHVRKREGQTCGFVQYPCREEAEMAMSQMQGYPISGQRLRLSWGKPEKHLDPDYFMTYYRQSAEKAYEGYKDFKARLERHEPRRETDPDFWISTDADVYLDMVDPISILENRYRVVFPGLLPR